MICVIPVETGSEGVSTMSDQPSRQVRVEFTGSGFALLGWMFLMNLASVVVIPAAWAAAAFNRWLFSNLKLSDGTRVAFVGRGEEIWGYFVVAALMGLVPQLGRLAGDEMLQSLAILGLSLLTLPLTAWAGVKIITWLVQRIELGCGTRLDFTGTWGAYLGWMVLYYVSAYTIIGWAWVAVALLNWLCRNVQAEGNQVRFTGRGAEVLWRVLVGALACALIIPIPWILAWWYKWGASCLVIESAPAVSPIAAPPPVTPPPSTP